MLVCVLLDFEQQVAKIQSPLTFVVQARIGLDGRALADTEDRVCKEQQGAKRAKVEYAKDIAIQATLLRCRVHGPEGLLHTAFALVVYGLIFPVIRDRDADGCVRGQHVGYRMDVAIGVGPAL